MNLEVQDGDDVAAAVVVVVVVVVVVRGVVVLEPRFGESLRIYLLFEVVEGL